MGHKVGGNVLLRVCLGSNIHFDHVLPHVSVCFECVSPHKVVNFDIYILSELIVRFEFVVPLLTCSCFIRFA